jgi:hypothetical protein
MGLCREVEIRSKNRPVLVLFVLYNYLWIIRNVRSSYIYSSIVHCLADPFDRSVF